MGYWIGHLTADRERRGCGLLVVGLGLVVLTGCAMRSGPERSPEPGHVRVEQRIARYFAETMAQIPALSASTTPIRVPLRERRQIFSRALVEALVAAGYVVDVGGSSALAQPLTVRREWSEDETGTDLAYEIAIGTVALRRAFRWQGDDVHVSGPLMVRGADTSSLRNNATVPD